MISRIPPPARSHRVVLILGFVCLFAAFAGAILVTAQRDDSQPSASAGHVTAPEAPVPLEATAKTRVAENFGKLPLSFEINKGQVDRSVKFLAHGPGYDLFLTPTEAVLSVQKPRAPQLDKDKEKAAASAEVNAREGTVLRLKMIGANATPTVEGQDELPGKVNYFTGNDPANWHRNVPTYKKAYFKNVYPGIDVVYYGNQRELEYDFVVAAGANPKLIRFTVEGADKTRIDKDGSLRLNLKHGEVSLNKPVIYQVDEKGNRREIKGAYVIKRNEVTFKLEHFDSGKPLVIDPVLSYSTLLGAGSNDNAAGIAVDSQGSAYITGSTSGTTFPTTAGAFKSTSTRSGAFITKLDPAGSTLIYSTYLSGVGTTNGLDIALDSAGNAHITGNTSATDFPTVNGLKTTSNFFKTSDAAANWNNQNSGLVGNVNAIAVAPGTPNTIYAASGNSIFRSTDGGSTWTKTPSNGLTSFNSATAMAVDPSNASVVYVGHFFGLFKSVDGGNNWTAINSAPLGSNFVSCIVFDPSTPSTLYVGANVGVVKSTDNGNTWITQTNFGIPGTPLIRALAIDPTAPLTLYAGTVSNGLFKSTNGGGVWTAMNNGMGGENATHVNSIAIDPANTSTIYTGHGSSSFGGGINKSTNGGTSWTPLTNGVPNAGIVAMAATTSGVYAAVNSAGIIKTTNGGTSWTKVDTGLWSPAVQSLVKHPTNPSVLYTGTIGAGLGDAFVTKLNASGSGLLFSTLLGGSDEEVGNGIAVDGSGNILVAGQTYSVNFPFANAVRSTVTFNGCTTGFVTKINPAAPSYTFSTYLGGGQCDFATSVATDTSGNVYVTGRTGSTDFPTANAFQPTLAGQFSAVDAFVSKLTPAGALIYSTYLGGANGSETGFGIAADASGNAYVTGLTTSMDFPMMNPLQGTPGGNSGDVFVTKFNSQGSALLYSTYLAGGGFDTGRDIAVDSTNHAYVTGYTESTNFPILPGALRTRSPLYKSVDGAANWSNDNFGFGGAAVTFQGATSVSALAIHPTQPSTIYTANGTAVFKSTNGGRTWAASTIGLPSGIVSLVIDPSTPSTLYALISSLSANSGVYKSVDDGGTWIRRSNGLFGSTLNSLAIDPVTPNTLYVGVSCCIGGSRIFKTTDGADNWAPLPDAPTTAPTSIVIDPLNHATVYAADAATPGGVFKSVDAGATWQILGSITFARSIAVSPHTSGVVYASTEQGIVKSTNGGSSWSTFTTKVGQIFFDPVSSSTLYWLTNAFDFAPEGLFKSINNGQTWFPVNKGLNTPQGTSLVIDPLRPSTLYLASMPSPGLEGFVTKIAPNGTAAIYSTFIGGSFEAVNFANLNTQSLGIAVDGSSNVYITGVTASSRFPATAGAYQPVNRGFNDAFVSKLTMSHIISGRVLMNGNNATPLSGAEVVLNDGGSLSGVFTENDGSYEFSRLRQGGNYTVSAVMPHFTMTPASQTFNNLNSDQLLNFNATTSASAFFTISGKITENGVALPGVKVTLSGSNSGIRTTDSNGDFSFELIVNGNYTVTPSLLGFNFGPVNQTFNNLTANQTANFAATRQNFVVTNANNHGSGSLRDAIINANATLGADTIVFNIPGPGVKTINVLTVLPEIIDRVTIDATTQPGYAGTPLIEVDGLGLGDNAHGLVIKAGNTTVRGLAIVNFRERNGIWLNNCDNNLIQGNYIGVAADGTTARPNSRGIVLTTSSSNVIGGTTAATRNVISGNSAVGIDITGNSNVVRGNFIGTNAAGTAALANTGGIAIFNPQSANNIIGGTTAGSGNLISGNQSLAISTAGTGTTIQGNLIGTDVTGTKKISNANGVQAIGTDMLIGGLTAGARNVISGNRADGVHIRGAGSKLQGNYVGTDITGTLALGNEGNGVVAGETALIGGTTPEARNIIAANNSFGNIALGQNNSGAAATVQGNYIGTDVTGTRALGGSAGIRILTNNHVIGGLVPGARNIISGNSVGIEISGFSGGPLGNVIQGNFIGLNAAGNAPVPNTQHGISMSSAVNNTIGGTQNEAANNIAYNGGAGVTLANGTGNTIRRNSIFSNNGLGIDLAPNGVTVNDSNDGDTGPNHLQNFPVISGVTSTASSTTIQGSLKSIPNTTFQIDFYSSSAVDPSGNGEGAQFFNTTSVNTDGNGNATINVTFPTGLASGRVITATATDPNGNTSEFSAADSTTTLGSVQFSVSSIRVIEDIGTITVTVQRKGGSTGTLNVEYATVDGTAIAGQDYTSKSGTLSFAAGETSKTLELVILNNATTETTETFTFELRNTSNPEAVGAPAAMVVTLQDSGTSPSLSISNVSVVEGNAGTTTDALFTLTLSAATGRTVTGNYTTSNAGATGGTSCSNPGVDYITHSPGSFTLNPGTTTFTIPVQICGDTNAESDESFRVFISNLTGAFLSTFQVFGSIVNDDILELILEESGPVAGQAAALDAILAVRDPFRVTGIPDWFPTEVDKNTRVALIARNLQLNPGEPSAFVTVRFSAAGGAVFDVPAEDVRPIPSTEFTQVIVRLPNNLPPGTCTVSIFAHSQFSNSGTIRIAP